MLFSVLDKKDEELIHQTKEKKSVQVRNSSLTNAKRDRPLLPDSESPTLTTQSPEIITLQCSSGS